MAERFEVPAADLLGRHRRGRSRPLAADITVYLVRVLRARTIAATAVELKISEGLVWTVCHRVHRWRMVDPELDRTIQKLEAELGRRQ